MMLCNKNNFKSCMKIEYIPYMYRVITKMLAMTFILTITLHEILYNTIITYVTANC